MIAIKHYRSEWKYCEESAKLLAIQNQIGAVMALDSYAGDNGKYIIHSLYFDDYKESCARENVAGEGKRFKYRIRFYGDNSESLWLEKKEKYNSYCHKRKCAISRKEYELLLASRPMEVFWNTDKTLLKELCIDMCTRRFVPKVIIDYERVAFVEPITNIRITFDYNISASDDVLRFLSGDYLKTPIHEANRHVLEVKFDDVLPSYIKSVLQSNTLIQQASSKYYLGRIAIQDRKKYTKII